MPVEMSYVRVFCSMYRLCQAGIIAQELLEEGLVMGMAMMVTTVAAGGSCHGGNSLRICYAILLWYADIVNIESNKDDNCAPTRPTIVGGNFDRGVRQLWQWRAVQVRG